MREEKITFGVNHFVIIQALSDEELGKVFRSIFNEKMVNAGMIKEPAKNVNLSEKLQLARAFMLGDC